MTTPVAGSAYYKTDASVPTTDPAPPGSAPQPSATISAEPEAPQDDATYVTTVNKNGQVATMENPHPATQKQIVPIANATTEYEEASAAANAVDQELMTQLAEVSPAMTDAERQQYIQAYRQLPENTSIYQREADAAAALRDAINDPRADLVAAGDPDCAAQVADAVELLSTTSEGEAALAWLARHFGADSAQGPNGNPAAEPYRELFSPERVDRVAEGGAEAGAVAASHSDTPIGNAEQIATQLQRLVNVGVGTTALKAALDLFNGVYEGAYRHDASRYGASFARAYEHGAGPRFGAAAYVLAGAFVAGGFFSSTDGSVEAQAKFLGDLALAAQGGVEVAGAAMKNAGGTFWEAAGNLLKKVPFLPPSASVQDAGKFLVRNAPLLGGLASIFYIVADTVGFLDDPSVAKAGVVVGDIMSLALLLPGGQAIGLVGIGISAVCALIDSFTTESQAEKRARTEAQLLGQVVPGLSPEAAARIAGQPEITVMYGDRLGLSPQQIRGQATSHPALFSDQTSAESFVLVAEALGFRGKAASDFADALLSGGDGESRFLNLASTVQTLGYESAPADVLISLLANDQELEQKLQPVMERYYPDFQEAVQRGRADRAFDLPAVGFFGPEMKLNTLGKYDHPAYRAQFIARAAQSRTLDVMVEWAADSTNAVDQSQRALLAQGIGDACRAGKLDPAQGNALVKALGYAGGIVLSGPV